MKKREQKGRGLVPRLRFPEFREKGEWGEKALSEVCRVTQGGTPDTTVRDFWGGSVQWATPADMGIGGSKYVARTARSITEAGLKNCSSELLPANSVIISTRAPIGYLAINHEPMAINQGCRGLIPEPTSDAHFVYYSLYKSKAQLQDLGSGNTFKELSGKTLKDFPLAFPEIREQSRIADCLSSLDELITAQTQKLDALKLHKKGLIQQLFPAEGETVPELRFPEFRGKGEWEEKSIQELIDSEIIIGHLDGNHGELYPRADEFSEMGIPYISAIDFANGSVDFSNCKYLPEHRAKRFKKGIAKNGDILFAHNATVGPVAPLKTNLDFVILSTTATYFRCDSLRLINDFLQYLLCCPLFVGQYSRVMKQSTRNQVPITTQRKFKLVLPKIEEQQKIAECLSSLDELISGEAQKLEALDRHKKGLMQNLFPVLETTE